VLAQERFALLLSCTAKAIEYMITDAMLEADPYLHISDMIDRPEEYVHLTDAILQDIAKSTHPVCFVLFLLISFTLTPTYRWRAWRASAYVR